MINKNQECDIVSDLLPLYLENKTSSESDEFIKMHLEHCEECRKNLKYMEVSYEDLFERKKRKQRKKIWVGFGEIKGMLFVFGYLFFLFCCWVYIIFGML